MNNKAITGCILLLTALLGGCSPTSPNSANIEQPHQANRLIYGHATELSGDLGINSIELADLVMLCEEKFEIEIDDENLHKLVTVGDVVNYLESL